MRTWTFDVEITRFAPGPVVRRATGADAADAEAMVRAVAQETCCVLIAQRDGATHGGDFYLWLAGDRALVRLDEHRERYAIDPLLAEPAPDAELEFRDSDGSAFTHAAAGTVSWEQALDALLYWLRTGELDPYLTWT